MAHDPSLNKVPDGNSVCSFTVATNRKWKASDGELHEEVEFHKVVAWGKLAESVVDWCKRGTKVYIEGHLKTREYMNKKGEKKQVTEIIAELFSVLFTKEKP